MKLNNTLAIVVAILLSTTVAFSAGTPAGTVISNFATGDYKDINGNSLPRVTSNTVTTIVTQVVGIDIHPPSISANFPTQESVFYSLEIYNVGNGPDNFDLTTVTGGTETGKYLVEIYHDIDSNGIIDGADSLVTGTGLLAADEIFNVIVVITDLGTAPDGDVLTVTITSTSTFDPTVSTTSIMTSTVTAATVTTILSVDNTNPQPGDVLTYSVCGENTGTATAYDVTIVGPIPDNTTYVPGSMRIGTTNDYTSAAPLTDTAGDYEVLPDLSNGDYNITTSNAVTIVWGDAPTGATGCVFYQVVVNADVPVNTEIANTGVTTTYANETGTAYPSENISGPGQSAFVAQVYGVLVGADLNNFANPGDFVTYPVSITNTGNGPDIINVNYTSTFWTWEIHSDFDGDNVIGVDDVVLTDTNGDGFLDIGTLLPGEIIYLIIAQTQVPAGSGDGDVNILTLTATSVGDPTASDQGICTTTVTAPVLSLTKTVSPTGSQPPGTTMTYRVDILNSGTGTATEVIISDAIPTNTTYVSGTMTVAGSSRTDVFDGDGATHNANAVTFEIPQLGPSGATYITFQVTID